MQAIVKNSTRTPFALMWITSFVVTFVLLYMDEGYYDFRWMKSIGNWIMFFVYVGFAFTGQFLVSILLNRFVSAPLAHWLTAIVGTTLGIGFLIFLLT